MTRRAPITSILFVVLILAPLAWAPRAQAAPSAEDIQEAQQNQQKLEALHQAWLKTADPAEKKKLGEQLINKAIRFDEQYDEMIYEVAAGGPIKPLEIKIPEKNETVKTRATAASLTVDPRAIPAWSDAAPFIDRRITENAVEVWTPKEGWLFDGKGRLKNHVTVPRRDGMGQEWFGAFLPDGRWVTTALWERDDTLYLYSKRGKFLKDIPSLAMADPETTASKTGGIIGWARSDKDGKGWVLALIGYYDERAHTWIGPDLNPHALDGIEPWERCLPRQLGVRYGRVPSDDGSRLLAGQEPGHGIGVGYPLFSVRRYPAYELMLREGGQFDLPPEKEPGEFSLQLTGHARSLGGFWPGSHNIFLFDKEKRTWFFDDQGKCQGWIAARRFADASDGRSMLFTPPDGRLVTLTPDLKVREVRRFVNANGAPLNPQGLYDDLNLGLFYDGNRLVMASWGRRAWYDPRPLLEWLGRPVKGLMRKIKG